MRQLWKAGMAVGLLMAVALGGGAGAAAAAAAPQQLRAGYVADVVEWLGRSQVALCSAVQGAASR